RPPGDGFAVRGGGRDDPDARLAGAEDRWGLGERAGAEHVEEEIVGELVVRAGIRDELVCAGLLRRVDEPRPAAAGAKCGGDDRIDPGVAFVIELERAV